MKDNHCIAQNAALFVDLSFRETYILTTLYNRTNQIFFSEFDGTETLPRTLDSGI